MKRLKTPSANVTGRGVGLCILWWHEVCFFLTVTDCGVDAPIVCRVGQAERTPILAGRRGPL
jgi:hypothetical protein